MLEDLNIEIETLDKAVANKAGIVEQRYISEGRYKKRVNLETARADLVNFTKAYNTQKD